MSRLSGLPSILKGETVTVLRRTVEYDDHNEPVETFEREDVDNVLVAPGSTASVEDTARPYGTKAVFTLGFPRTYSKPLRGCRIIVRCPNSEDETDHTYSVVGDPQPNNADNCPTAWWYTAEVERVDG